MCARLPARCHERDRVGDQQSGDIRGKKRPLNHRPLSLEAAPLGSRDDERFGKRKLSDRGEWHLDRIRRDASGV